MKYAIHAARFLLEQEEAGPGYLIVEDGRFGEITAEAPPEMDIIDYSDYTIAPGLFDTHIHGIGGYDIMDGTVEAVQEISKALLPLGVTRFLPTTLTSSPADLEQAIVSIQKAVETGLSGAQSAGIFLEGPYFTEEHKGAQNPAYFRDPDVAEFHKWQELADGTIVKIAIAPERNQAVAFTKEMSKEVLVSLGHTNATFDCCQELVDAGARKYVHLFNGMRGLHHREPGVVGAALTDSRAYAEMICDGHHVHPQVATHAYATKQDKLVLITDCMRAGNMPDGNYMLGEFPVVMQDGIARTEAGSLAGSTLLLKNGVKNLQAWSGSPLYDVWHRASLSPAASLGLEEQFGSIASGKTADFVAMDDSFNVHATAIAGEIRFESKK